MPQLPKGNKMDYNPDNIIQASKRLTTIALEQMKNPLFDPDQSTLSSLDAERNLTDNFTEFGRRILEIKTLFNTARNLGVALYKKKEVEYDEAEGLQEEEFVGMSPEEMDDFERWLEGALENEAIRRSEEMRGKGIGGTRTKGAKDKAPRKKRVLALPSPVQEEEVTTEIVPKKRYSLKKLREEREQKIRDQYAKYWRLYLQSKLPVERPIAPVVASSEPVGRYGKLPMLEYAQRGEADGYDADEIPDWEYNDYADDYDPFANYGYERDESDKSVPVPMPAPAPLPPVINISDALLKPDPNTSLENTIIELTKRIRALDILLISKIKPALQKLNADQLQQLRDAYDLLGQIWKEFSILPVLNKGKKTGNFVSIFGVTDELQYGANMVSLLKDEMDKLRMDLLVTINSYKQNEAIAPPFYVPFGNEWKTQSYRELVETGERLDGDGVPSQVSAFTGSGRMRDEPKVLGIPSIWNTSTRNCPVKYLL